MARRPAPSASRRSRPDLPPGCREEVDLEFLRWIWRFRRTRLPRIVDRLRTFEGEMHVLRGRRDVRRFLDELDQAAAAR